LILLNRPKYLFRQLGYIKSQIGIIQILEKNGAFKYNKTRFFDKIYSFDIYYFTYQHKKQKTFEPLSITETSFHGI